MLGNRDARKEIDLPGNLYSRVVTTQPGYDAASSTTLIATNVGSAGGVLKASPGYLVDFNFVTAASAGYLMFFNSVSVPADGTVTPLYVMPIAANTGMDNQFNFPRRFTTGISWSFSTTGPFTKTAGSASNFLAAAVV